MTNERNSKIYESISMCGIDVWMVAFVCVTIAIVVPSICVSYSSVWVYCRFSMLALRQLLFRLRFDVREIETEHPTKDPPHRFRQCSDEIWSSNSFKRKFELMKAKRKTPCPWDDAYYHHHGNWTLGPLTYVWSTGLAIQNVSGRNVRFFDKMSRC